MPRDFADDPRVKSLPSRHRKKMIESLQDAEAQQTWNELAAEIQEGREARKMLPEVLGKLEAVEAALARPFVLKQPEPPKKKELQQKIGATRMLSVALAAEATRHCNSADRHRDMPDIIEQYLPGKTYAQSRERAFHMHYKSSVVPASTTAAGWAAELVNSTVQSFWDDQKETSVLAQLRSMSLPLYFQGANSVTIPSRGPKAINSAWVEERASIPVDEANFASRTLWRTKRAVIVAVTRDLVQVSNPAVLPLLDGYIRDDLTAQLDADLISTNAPVAGVSPAGILTGAPTQASTGMGFADIVADIRWLRGQLTNVIRRPVLVCSDKMRLYLESMLDTSGDNFPFRAELQERGTVLGYRVLSSPYVDDTLLVMLDAFNFTSAADPVAIDASATATLVLTDSADPDPHMGAGDGTVTEPTSTHISDAAATVPPSDVRSLFQTNSVALRMIAPISWGMRSEGKVAYITGVAP